MQELDLVKHLKDLIPKIGKKQCQKLFNLTLSEINTLIKENKLPSRKTTITKNGVIKKSWTEDELNILKKYYPEGGTKECKKYLKDRADQDIRSKARRIGLFFRDLGRFYTKGSNNKHCADKNGYITCLICKETKLANSENFVYRKQRLTYKTICKPCVALRVKEQRSYEKTFLQRMWVGIKNRKSKIKVDKLISYEDVLEIWEKQNKLCALTGIKLTTITGQGRVPTNVSIDRIDNKKGYTKENVQLVCFWANVAKNDLSVSDFKHFCKLVTSYQSAYSDPIMCDDSNS